MSSGAKSQPPDLPNFEYRSWLGGGGFADVFLYEQRRPQRQVAIKVLRTPSLEVSDQHTFDAEANLMAKVSAHPYIVSVYGADVAPDGRPFLVMEYYPKPHFGQQMRQGGLTVPEVLRVGVRVGSAVETAHRSGISHRDIKPANILVSEYDRPGLTDFGIAGSKDGSVLSEAQGVTVAYAPPEVLLDESAGDEASDVYSLAATLYALLAGRAPHEARGGDNTAQAMLQRTLSGSAGPIGRDDVPPSLELLLSQAMAKDPAHRPSSAASLARALQGIERELHLATTDFELAGTDVLVAPARTDDDEDGTRANRIQVVRPAAAPSPPAVPIVGVPQQLSHDGDTIAPRRVVGKVPEAPPATDTVARQPAPTEPEAIAQAEPSPPDRKRLVVAAGGALVVVAIVLGVLVTGGGDDPEATTTTTAPPDDSALVVPDLPPAPTDVRVTVSDGVAEVTWEPGESAEPDDVYQVRISGIAGGQRVERASQPPLRVGGIGATDVPCAQVSAVRGVRPSPPAQEVCAR